MTPQGWQHVADVGRAVSIPVSVITATISLRVAVDRRYRSGSQLCRFMGLAVLCLTLSFAQYHALGRDPYWPVLIPLWAGLLLSLAGTLPLATRQMRSESLLPNPEYENDHSREG